ncbi:hypothetical protein TGFOU_366570 [Toxoplasma gondii FOU]|uniref:Uncharacterized protein n=2 Tax=Toxoplasma gondii TaxID=5811 RepID=A0A086JXS9_TOXGO|nr:hypothetical protein TGFOU_366570 [Toxoplasma gondii FOU]PUA85753.1 hypothetical protein TGBR9_366570 [Toxoplasma gondii TgCATBr9]
MCAVPMESEVTRATVFSHAPRNRHSGERYDSNLFTRNEKNRRCQEEARLSKHQQTKGKENWSWSPLKKVLSQDHISKLKYTIHVYEHMVWMVEARVKCGQTKKDAANMFERETEEID